MAKREQSRGAAQTGPARAKRRTPTDKEAAEYAAAIEQHREMARADQESQQAIGEFIFEFSQLEFTLRALLCASIQLDDRYFDAVLAGFDFSRLCTSLSAANDVNYAGHPEVIGHYARLIARARKLNDKRVIIAHATWVSGPQGGLAARAVSRGKMVADYAFEHRQELRDDANAIRQLMAEFIFAPPILKKQIETARPAVKGGKPKPAR